MGRTASKKYQGKVKNIRPLTAPWSILIVDLLAEHGELSYEYLIAEAAHTVPPGRARRRRDEGRVRSSKRPANKSKTGQEYVANDVSVDDQVLYGRRAIVRWSLTTLTDSGRIVRIERDGKWFYRLGEVELAHRKAKTGGGSSG
jgi:hypothetical protein